MSFTGGRRSEKSNLDQEKEKLERLYRWEAHAIAGKKLKGRDRLLAGQYLSRIWNQANEQGLKQKDFETQVRHRLPRHHKGSEEFRLSRWRLPDKVDPYSDEALERLERLKTPQGDLKTFLVAVEVAAEHCGERADSWKMGLLERLSIWRKDLETPNLKVLSDRLVAEVDEDERSFEMLALYLNELGKVLAEKNDLPQLMKAIDPKFFRWEMFDERLVLQDNPCMVGSGSPVFPNWDDERHFEEMFPFPSVPLVRIPWLVADTHFWTVPEDKIVAPDPACADRETKPRWVHDLEGRSSIDVRKVIPGFEDLVHFDAGRLIYHREVRLCVAPVGPKDFGMVLESRPAVQVRLPPGSTHAGLHDVHAAFEPNLLAPLFYSRGPDGLEVWPAIESQGRRWRIGLASGSFAGFDMGAIYTRFPEETDFGFDPDPVVAPGLVEDGPWYITYTPALPAYLKHWLTGNHELGGDFPRYTWLARYFSPDQFERHLPPPGARYAAPLTPAADLEACLHNGLIEEAFQALIDSLKRQVVELHAERLRRKDHYAQELLKRWKTKNTPSRSA